MPLAFAILQQRRHVVMIQPGFEPHGNGLDLEHAASRPGFKMDQRRAQQIVERISERSPPGPAFALQPFQNVLIERNCRADAYDAFRIASNASR
jgi:hypothetical protein